jgi:hypothetical protein
MSRSIPALALAALLVSPLGAVAQEPGGAVPVPEDLHSVLLLRGKECERLVAHERRGPSDYLVTCSGGERYRIWVDPDGHVNVEER